MEEQISTVKGMNQGTDQLLQEPFIRQVEDASLPARQVLVAQRESQRPDLPAPLFVP